MDMVNQSLQIVPSSHADHDSKSLTETANSFGVHDTLRYGIRTIESEILEKHSLENRLKHWDETRTNLNLTMQRRLYGMHAPIRVLMERNIVSRVQRIPVLPSSNLSLDILTGKDETIDFEDFLNEPESSTEMMNVHAIMEHKLGIKPSAFN
ncbi:5681_t:CDS:2 [Funneliformis caledonium]|uniref:5681_t:CDS:1 n=2 Tax=Funneliformis TaxID=1117308 RepID=A0A9N8YS30_9GLOM|nr:5681_t:CDS:2 [Funneliformis caledonium]CAG8500786.1 14950_t:CDS:2 [Funneliformis mosseae]